VKNKNHIAIYGAVKIKRGHCKKCKDYAFIIDKTFTCCNSSVDGKINKYKRMSDASGIRRKPNVKIQMNILNNQRNKCKYCDIEFGELYFKSNKPFISRVHWDHLVPFSYLQENPYGNWIASCNICNSIKSNKVFETIQEVKDYVVYHRKKKEIFYLHEIKI
jgi:hypothetical protein